VQRLLVQESQDPELQRHDYPLCILLIPTTYV